MGLLVPALKIESNFNYLFAARNYVRLFGKLEKGDAAVVKSVTFRNEIEGNRLNFSTLSDT